MKVINWEQYCEVLMQPIESAESLPFTAYRDPEVMNNEVESIFHNDWVFVCAQQQLPHPGDYLSIILVGEPLVIVHGQDGKIRALSNNCRHRGTPLLDKGFGKLDKKIVCPYHAWTYTDSGIFKGAPYTHSTKLNQAAHCLENYPLECWHGLLFVNLCKHPKPLHERLNGITPFIKNFEIERFTIGYSAVTEQWSANWKLAVENSIESYHLFKVHSNTLERITPTKDSFYITGSSEWTITAGRIKEQRSKLSRWFSGETPEVLQHYILLFIPPSFIGIITYESFDWINILPLSVDQCMVHSGGMSTHLPEGDQIRQHLDSELFLTEDKEICERVQTGMYANLGRGGKLVELERILIDFRQYLLSRQFDADPLPPFTALKAKAFRVD